ncbi:MAG TPA: hypothetical protein VFZ91_06665 [Allosphingosinicella sp.]
MALAIGALCAGTALAGEPAAAETQAKAGKNDGSKRVCRNLTPSGTRLTVRMCRTRAEWEASQDRAQESALKHQMNESTQLEQAPRP